MHFVGIPTLIIFPFATKFCLLRFFVSKSLYLSISSEFSIIGYSVVGSEVLSAQKMNKQHYNYSSNSAVTVASSENGAMMLEVVGKRMKMEQMAQLLQ